MALLPRCFTFTLTMAPRRGGRRVRVRGSPFPSPEPRSVYVRCRFEVVRKLPLELQVRPFDLVQAERHGLAWRRLESDYTAENAVKTPSQCLRLSTGSRRRILAF